MTEIHPGDATRVRSLEAEVLTLKRQVEVRDEMLRSLNRRLLQLERGETDTQRIKPGETKRLEEENRYLRRLVHSFLDADMFRWTIPVRRLHGRLYSRRHGST